MRGVHEHVWLQGYYGITCIECGLFYPDNGNWFAPLDDDPAEDDVEEEDDE